MGSNGSRNFSRTASPSGTKTDDAKPEVVMVVGILVGLPQVIHIGLFYEKNGSNGSRNFSRTASPTLTSALKLSVVVMVVGILVGLPQTSTPNLHREQPGSNGSRNFSRTASNQLDLCVQTWVV